MVDGSAGTKVIENGCAARVSGGVSVALFRLTQPVGVVTVTVAVADVTVPAAFVTFRVNVVVPATLVTTVDPDVGTETAPGLIDPVPPLNTKLSWVAPPPKMLVGAAMKVVITAGSTTSKAVLSSPGVPVTAACSL